MHAVCRDDSLARTKSEPIAMWLVRCNEQLGKLNRVGIDIFTALPDVAGWQASNLAGLTEDRVERVVSWLPDDTCPLDTISAELNRVFASVPMSEPVSSTTAIRPGRAWSSNERERVPRPVRRHYLLGTIQTHICGRKNPKSFCFVRTVGHVGGGCRYRGRGQ